MTRDWEPSENFDDWGGCRLCVHWRAGKCAAYPHHIPFPLIAGQVDHLVKRPGQVGDTIYEEIDFEEWHRTGRRVPAKAPAQPR
jgi:hypothetical protein